ncbi:MAG: hypothetical protein HRT87_02910 [Legionellales bacterium]|nr:hypothetical protein [Legionellales bacterium]
MKNKYTLIDRTTIFIAKIILISLKPIMFLPYKYILVIGKLLGLAIFFFSKRLRIITEINIELCLKSLPEDKRHALIKESFISLGMGFMETLFAWLAPDHRLPKLHNIHGLEYIENAIKNNKNIIMLGVHQVSAELCGRMFHSLYPFNAVYQKPSNPVIHELILSRRKNIYKDLIDNSKIRTMIKVLQNKEMIWFAPDQGQRRKQSVFVPFFGINAATSTSTSKIANLADAIVIPSSCCRTKDYSGYEITFHPKLNNFPSDSFENDAKQINAVYEKIIQANPEQYLWQYKRFKNTQDFSTNVYDQKLKK